MGMVLGLMGVVERLLQIHSRTGLEWVRGGRAFQQHVGRIGVGERGVPRR